MSQMVQPSEGRRTAQPSIVGRVREWRMLNEVLTSARSGHGSVVLIGGEAGIGKTTLVQELAHEARAGGAFVLSGGGYDLSATTPYGLWLELARSYQARNGSPSLPHVLSRTTISGGNLNPADLLEAAHSFIDSLATHATVVLTLEDLHWADPASLDLLRSLCRRIDSSNVLLIGTWRIDELTHDRPLYQLLPHLIREAHAERLDLGPLDDAAVRQMIAGRYQLAPPDESRLVEYVQARAEGNPFFINEIVRTLEDEDFLQHSDTGWSLRDLERVPVPALVSQIITNRVGRIDRRARDLISLAAVIGQEVPLDLWKSIGAASEDELSAAIEAAQDAHLMRESADGGSVRFMHALVREAIHAGVVLNRRRIWHRRIADAMMSSRHPDPDHVAWHLQQAGDDRAVEWLVRAGDRAVRTYSMLMAAERFNAAAALLERDPSRASDCGWLLYRTGRMLRYAEPTRSISYLERARKLAAAANDPVLAAYALFDQGMVRCFTADVSHGIVQMEAGHAAIGALPDDHAPPGSEIAQSIADALPSMEESTIESVGPVRQSRTRTGSLSLWLSMVGRLDEGRALAERYLAEIGDVGDDAALLGSVADAWAGLSRVASACGRPEDAVRASTRACDANRAIDHYTQVSGQYWVLFYGVVVPYQTDRVSDRRHVVADVEALFTGWHGAAQHSGWARLARLYLQFLEGPWLDDEEIVNRARRLTGNFVTISYYLYVFALFARHRGRPDIAWQLINRVLPNGPATEPGTIPFDYAINLVCLAAGIALDTRDLETGRAWLDTLGRWLDWTNAFLGRSEGERLSARYWYGMGDRQRARRHAEESLRLAANPRQPLALLATRRLLGQFDTEAGNYSAAAQRLEEALRLAERCELPFERARTLLALAELRAATGIADEARTLAEHARTICLTLGARPTLNRADALLARLTPAETARYPSGLSPREMDVLRLVAQGLSDAEVAGRLGLARRTVNSHLTSIYTKLNVNSRVAATRFALDHGLA